MTKKAKWIFAVSFSFVISIVTVWLINQYLQQETSRRLEEASRSTGSVVVFAKDLTAGHVLSAKDLLARKYPEELINENWYVEREAGLVLGRQLRDSVEPGEPVSERVLVNNRNSGLSEKLPNGYYAITVNTDNLGHHNALLKEGDVVDIVFVGDSFDRGREYNAFSSIEIFETHGLEEGYGSYSLTLLIAPNEVKSFTRALGSPMLVWARGRQLSKTKVWSKDLKQSKVEPWKVQ
ncbi:MULTISPECIES: SAF domain-containing protein [Idiomarina]|jgi:pilus assembly protein CpaB|uniref:Flp pilus assembly protein CpaB n=1 Tax=Idiomarina TaxID=135575 RepID=UPI000C44CF7F|nr:MULTISPECIES: SAF domain-containing protein [Idiomarina]MAO67717.1 pilus assembly protein CpaB [Idiomarina sp.]MBF79409.1 pilus assembly protein CpaB [Idiomarina sp.]|tara:strand:- start:249 stop:956 length:708 start_codon:yes stop_codon:yes gene_type:complete